MNTKIIEAKITTTEQKFILPGYHSWTQFKTIQSVVKKTGVKISFLDGVIELMTLGEQHEIIKSMIAILLGIYFWHKKIDFIPVGSATRESKEQQVSFEPDESYYLGEKKTHPDLAIEVNITSGSIKKLEKYRRFNITEVWFWENNKFLIYHLTNNNYQEISQSQLLPDLDFQLLEKCVLMSSKLEAINTFSKNLT